MPTIIKTIADSNGNCCCRDDSCQLCTTTTTAAPTTTTPVPTTTTAAPTSMCIDAPVGSGTYTVVGTHNGQPMWSDGTNYVYWVPGGAGGSWYFADRAPGSPGTPTLHDFSNNVAVGVMPWNAVWNNTNVQQYDCTTTAIPVTTTLGPCGYYCADTSSYIPYAVEVVISAVTYTYVLQTADIATSCFYKLCNCDSMLHSCDTTSLYYDTGLSKWLFTIDDSTFYERSNTNPLGSYTRYSGTGPTTATITELCCTPDGSHYPCCIPEPCIIEGFDVGQECTTTIAPPTPAPTTTTQAPGPTTTAAPTTTTKAPACGPPISYGACSTLFMDGTPVIPVAEWVIDTNNLEARLGGEACCGSVSDTNPPFYFNGGQYTQLFSYNNTAGKTLFDHLKGTMNCSILNGTPPGEPAGTTWQFTDDIQFQFKIRNDFGRSVHIRANIWVEQHKDSFEINFSNNLSSVNMTAYPESNTSWYALYPDRSWNGNTWSSTNGGFRRNCFWCLGADECMTWTWTSESTLWDFQIGAWTPCQGENTVRCQGLNHAITPCECNGFLGATAPACDDGWYVDFAPFDNNTNLGNKTQFALDYKVEDCKGQNFLAADQSMVPFVSAWSPSTWDCP